MKRIDKSKLPILFLIFFVNNCFSMSLAQFSENLSIRQLRILLKKSYYYLINYCRAIGPISISDTVSKGDLFVLRRLLKKGISVNSVSSKKNPIISVAIYTKRLNIVKELIGHGADINKVNSEGDTPLLIAIKMQYRKKSDRSDIVKFLLENGADVNRSSQEGDTPLHVVMEQRWRNNKKIVRLLLESGANVNAKNNENNTPLFLATRHHLYNLAEILIINGATYIDGNTLGIHSYITDRVLLEFIKKRGQCLYYFTKLCENQDYVLLNKFLAHKDNNNYININMKNKNGETLLFDALIKDDTERLLWLIDQGININIKNSKMQSVLEIAKQNNNTNYELLNNLETIKSEVLKALEDLNKHEIKFLIGKYRAILVLRLNNEGDTLLHVLIDIICNIRDDQETQNELIEIIKLIIENEPKVVLVKNYSNISSLERAISCASEVLNIILEIAYIEQNKRDLALDSIN